MTDAKANAKAKTLTRRSFLAGGGLLIASFAVPVIPGASGEGDPGQTGAASLFSPTVAYAKDSEVTFEVTVSTESTTVFRVVDASKLGSVDSAADLPPVAGAEVSCYDASSSKTYTGTTDSQGYLYIDISEGTQRSTNEFKPAYSADLQVGVSGSGHRELSIDLLHVQGAKLYYLASPETQSNETYFRAVGFNGRDVQYSKATFLNATTNDAEQTLSAEVRLNVGDIPATSVKFCCWRGTGATYPGYSSQDVDVLGTVELKKKQMISQSGDLCVCRVELKGRFLQGNYGLAFNPGNRFVASIVQNGREYAIVTLAEFRRPPFDGTGSGNRDTIPGVPLIGGNSFALPSNVPIVGGSTFSWWKPTDLCKFRWSPFGYISLTISDGLLGTSTDDSPLNTDAWKLYSFENAKEEAEYQQKCIKKRQDNVKDMRKAMTSPKAKGMDKYFNATILPKYTLFIGAGLSLYASYDWADTEAWKVGVNLAFSFGGAALYDIQMMIGPVPVFISVSFGLTFTFALSIGGVTYWPDGDEQFEDKLAKFFDGMTLDYKNTQIAMVLCFDMGVTGGVGIAGVASIGIRYAASFTLYISFYEDVRGKPDETYQFPHTMVFMDMSLSIAVQLFLFKCNINIWKIEGKDRVLYDSWEGEGQAASLESALATALSDDSVPDEGTDDGIQRDADGNYRISLEYLAEHADEVTADDLEAGREFSTVTAATSRAAALGEDEVKLVSVAHPDESGLYTIVCGTDAQVAGVRAGLGYEDEDVVPDVGDADETGADAAAAVAALSADAAADAVVQDGDAEEYVYPDTGITVDENSYVRSKYVLDDDAASSISGIAADGGVTAASGKFMSNVFSDGRPKFMEIDGVLTMFRIAAVDCNGQMRTRLVVQRKIDGKWSEAAPIDFNPMGIGDLSRDDLYDYDFDVATVKPADDFWKDSTDNHNDVVILLFSGTRDYTDAASDTASRLEASSGQHVSTIIDYGFVPYKGFEVKTSLSWRTFADAASYGSNQIFAFMPRVNVEVNKISSGGFFSKSTLLVCVTCAYAYRHQDKDSKTSILSSDVLSHIAVATTYFTVNAGFNGYGYLSVNEPLKYVSGEVFSGFEGDVTYLTDGPSVMLYSSGDEYKWSSFFGVQVERKDAQGKAEKAFGVMKVAATQSPDKITHDTSVFYQPDASIKRLVPWPGQDAMIAMRQTLGADNEKYDVAYRLEFNLEGQGGSFPAGTQIGPSIGLPLDFTIISNGKALLYADNQKNKYTPVYDDNGNPVLDEQGYPVTKQTEGSYRIMAMKAVEDGGKVALSKPFSACTLSHAIDTVVAVATGNEVTDIIGLEIADIDKSLANYWEISVPCIACATPTEIHAVGGMVIPGQACTFEIGLRNDGNTILRGTELRLIDADTQKVLYDSVSVAFSSETIVGSSDMKAASDDPAGTQEVTYETGYEALGDHMLGKDGGRNILAPGRFARVSAKITVPDNWAKKQKIVVKTCKLTYIDPITSDTSITSSLATFDESTGTYAYASGIAGLDGGSGGDLFGAQGDEACCEVTVGVASGTTENMGYPEAVVIDGQEDDEKGGSGSGGDGSGSASGGGNSSSSSDSGSGNGSSGTGSNSKKTTPTTGDSAIGGIGGVVAAAAGAIGLGFAAYSNRRLEVEREEREILEVDATVIDDES